MRVSDLIPDIQAHAVDGKTIVEISIAEYPIKPVNTRGRYYKRIASSNHALQLSWDAYEAPRVRFPCKSQPL